MNLTFGILRFDPSRSDEMSLAVGFSPRITVESNLRRVATVETSTTNQSSLRDAALYCDRIRGLKPTAKVMRHYAAPQLRNVKSQMTNVK